MAVTNDLIDLDRALQMVRAAPVSVRVETIRLDDALGRVLARPVASPIDSPPFDKSAMDGFAVRAEETAEELRIVETVAAGGVPVREVGRGEAARIMTGAMLPAGTSRVIRREYVREHGETIRVLTAETGSNVIPRGASIRAGDPVLQPKVIAPQDVGILAASGIDRLEAAVPPRVAVVCTGPEIRRPGEPLGRGEIYDSNGPQLRAQLALVGCTARVTSGIPDRPGPLAAVIAREMESSDVLLLTGGVSAGDFDYVPGALKGAGAEVLFHRVSVKPGKPTLFARRGSQFFFGLPGKPGFHVRHLRSLREAVPLPHDGPGLEACRGEGKAPQGRSPGRRGPHRVHPGALPRRHGRSGCLPWVGPPQRTGRRQRAHPCGARGHRDQRRDRDRCSIDLTAPSRTCASP